VAQRSPINSAIALLFTFICVASLYILHGSPMLAMIQIMVYAGAILILVVFAIMLLALREPGVGLTRLWTFPQKVAGAIASAILAGQLLYLAWFARMGNAATEALSASQLAAPAELGRALFDKYLLPFEAASVLLLAAIVGAVALTRRPKGTPAAIDANPADEARPEEAAR
jgi:NADH-quinone oxidoreductase subunit J